MSCTVRGWKFRVAVEGGDNGGQGAQTFDANSEIYFPSAVELTDAQELVPIPGTRGSRALYADQVVRGNLAVGGALNLRFGRKDLDRWLPRILGAAEAADAFKPAAALPWFSVLVDKGEFRSEYRDCKVTRATFSGSAGGPVELALDVVGKTYHDYAGAFPAISYAPGEHTRPLRFAEGSLTVDGIAILFEQFTLAIDNQVEPKFYAGAETATCLDEGRRVVTLRVPAGFTAAAKELYKRGDEGLAAVLTFDNGTGGVTTVTMPAMKWARRSPTMNGEGAVPLQLEMVAYRTEAGDAGADDDILVTNVQN